MKRNKFSLSNTKLASFSMGELVPVGLLEVLPGDSIQQATSALVRTTPLVAPVMHPVHVHICHFFVPHRLVWTDRGGANTGWEAFITGGPAGTSTPTLPYRTIPAGGYDPGTLADYLGVPPDLGVGLQINALPFRGYSLIWNEFFRDQDLETALTIDTTDGSDTTTNVNLQKCAWEKDYFTVARPWTQKGTEVTLPLGTVAPVVGTGTKVPTFKVSGTTGAELALKSTNASTNTDWNGTADTTGDQGWFTTSLEANLTGATAASVNTIREAFALQRYKEARAMYGSRYTEYLRYLGVKSSDARLQRPEYLGGGKQTLQFSEVLQTGPSASEDGVGNMAGHGITAVRSNRYRRFFEEHGYIYTLMYVRPKTIYGNGLSRHWSYTTKEDFWQKELEHIGQQEIYNREVYLGDSGPNDVFGYGDRYDHLRRQESSISGDFRQTSLDDWNMARIFAGDVTLNNAFVSCEPTTRIYQSTSTDNLLVMVYNSIQARRMVSSNATPSIF